MGLKLNRHNNIGEVKSTEKQLTRKVVRGRDLAQGLDLIPVPDIDEDDAVVLQTLLDVVEIEVRLASRKPDQAKKQQGQFEEVGHFGSVFVTFCHLTLTLSRDNRKFFYQF